MARDCIIFLFDNLLSITTLLRWISLLIWYAPRLLMSIRLAAPTSYIGASPLILSTPRILEFIICMASLTFKCPSKKTRETGELYFDESIEIMPKAAFQKFQIPVSHLLPSHTRPKLLNILP